MTRSKLEEYDFEVVFHVRASSQEDAEDSVYKRLAAGGVSDKCEVYVPECSRCMMSRDHYLHESAAGCKDCKAPYEHHAFVSK